MSIPENGDAETANLDDHEALLTASSANDSAIVVSGSGTSGGQRSSSTAEMEVIRRIDDLDRTNDHQQISPSNAQIIQKSSPNRRTGG